MDKLIAPESKQKLQKKALERPKTVNYVKVLVSGILCLGIALCAVILEDFRAASRYEHRCSSP